MHSTIRSRLSALLLFFLAAAQTRAAGVTNISLGGPKYSTIQAAVNAAAAGNTLRVSTGVYAESVWISNKTLTVDGKWNGSFTSKSGMGSSVVNPAADTSCVVATSSTLAFQDMTFSGGGGPTLVFGGGLSINYCPSVTISNCLVNNNTARNGGGMYVYQSSLLAHNSALYQNTADFGGGAGISGSIGIFRGVNCRIYQNTADWGGGIRAAFSDITMDSGAMAYGNSALAGGGMFIMDSSMLVSGSGTIIGTTGGNENTAVHGGGIFAVQQARVVVSNQATVRCNIATNGGGAYVFGSTLVLTDRGRFGYDDIASTNYAATEGGCIYVTNGSVIVSNATISSGAAIDGGGIFAVRSTVLLLGGTVVGSTNAAWSNRAVSGGGIRANDSSLLLDHALVAGNRSGWGSLGSGGGIYLLDTILTARHAIVQHNVTPGSGAGICGLYSFGTVLDATSVMSNSAGRGGGLFANCSWVNLQNGCTFRGNVSETEGGAVLLMNAASMYATDTAWFDNNQATNSGGGIFVAYNSVFSCLAGTYGGIVFRGNRAGDSGGAMCLSGMNSRAALANVEFTDYFGVSNRAQKITAAAGGGGAIAAFDGALVALTNVQIRSSLSANAGGALYFDYSSLITGTDPATAPDDGLPANRFIGNRATFGSVGWFKNAAVKATDALMVRNIGAGNGAALRLNASTSVFVNTVIADTDITGLNSAIELLNGKALFLHSTIANNDAQGIGSQNTPQIALSNCIVWGNARYQVTNGQTVAYSDIQGGYPGMANFSADPLFSNTNTLDYSLRPGSPCIASGVFVGVMADCIGSPRSPTAPDIGAYEFVPEPLAAGAATAICCLLFAARKRQVRKV